MDIDRLVTDWFKPKDNSFQRTQHATEEITLFLRATPLYALLVHIIPYQTHSRVYPVRPLLINWSVSFASINQCPIPAICLNKRRHQPLNGNFSCKLRLKTVARFYEPKGSIRVPPSTVHLRKSLTKGDSCTLASAAMEE